MASVRPTKEGKWQAVWRVGGRGGKRPQRSKTFDRKTDAKAYALQMESEYERPGVGDATRMNVIGYLRSWHRKLVERGELEPTSLDSYKRSIDIAERAMPDIPLNQLTGEHLRDLYPELARTGKRMKDKPEFRGPLADRTLLHVHRMLRTALEAARRRRLVSHNCADDVDAPSVRHSKAAAFTAEQVERLFAAAEAEAELFLKLSLLFTGGLRRSELLGLASDAIDFANGTLTVSRTVVSVNHTALLRERAKTESSLRTISMPANVMALLRQQLVRRQEAALRWGRGYKLTPAFVFAEPDGGHQRPQRLSDELRNLLKRAGISGGFAPCHAWRHTMGTTLYDRTGNLKTVQQRLGHSTPAITGALYVHPVASRDVEAADFLGGLIKKRATEE
jgi:integrase